ncbi:MAG: hypothetical protein PHP03_02095 [Candidatus Pacebacteria bacterium]|nr:hypothetical protein [Candidatus Paceibacterota bacterium]
MENEEPKISTVEIVFITPFLLIADAVGVFLVIIALDDMGLIDVLMFPFNQIYLRMKGVRATTMLVGSILELLPYIGALPMYTLTWALTIAADRKWIGGLDTIAKTADTLKAKK